METIVRIPPRDVADRDSKYMGLAWIWAGFSKDPNTQIGAQIVDQHNIPLGSGYNGPPRLIDDDSFSWERRQDDDALSKYDVVIHAEINAIKHSFGHNLSNATIYVTGFPCKDCMKAIIQEEIERIVYFDYKSDSDSMLQKTQMNKSENIARLAGMTIQKFNGNINWMCDWIDYLKLRGIFKNVDDL
jgi:dCMP deaminase